MTDPFYALAKLSVPIGVITTIVGGSAWLTTTHNATVENTRNIHEIKEDLKILDDQNDKNSERLGRIEAKIDFIVKAIDRQDHD